MTPLDALLLIMYSLIAHRVINQAIGKLDKRAKVNLSEDKLSADLTARNLQDTVEFGFAFEKTYSLSDSLNKLSISVTNKRESGATLYVNWDRSSLTNYGERSRRVIRLTPNRSPDLVRPQVWSVIPPKQQLQEAITAEDVLSRESETDPLELTGVIVPIERPKPKEGEPEPEGPPTFYLCVWLVVQLTNPETGGTENFEYLLPFEFVISKCPWTDALPW